MLSRFTLSRMNSTVSIYKTTRKIRNRTDCNHGTGKTGIAGFGGLLMAMFNAVLLIVLVAIPLDASHAQDSQDTMQNKMKGEVKSKHGAWSLICNTPPGAKSEQCAVMQNVIAEDRQEVGLSVLVLRTADRKSELLRVLAPLGVLLPSGLGLNVDGQSIGNAYFVRCFQDGCYAEVVLNEKLINTLKGGKTATFIIFQTPEEGIGIPVDLSGFTEAYEAIP